MSGTIEFRPENVTLTFPVDEFKNTFLARPLGEESALRKLWLDFLDKEINPNYLEDPLWTQQTMWLLLRELGMVARLQMADGDDKVAFRHLMFEIEKSYEITKRAYKAYGPSKRHNVELFILYLENAMFRFGEIWIEFMILFAEIAPSVYNTALFDRLTELELFVRSEWLHREGSAHIRGHFQTLVNHEKFPKIVDDVRNFNKLTDEITHRNIEPRLMNYFGEFMGQHLYSGLPYDDMPQGYS